MTRFDPASIFRVKMQIIRMRTLLTGVFVFLFFLLPVPLRAADAQNVPCDNSQAEAVIPVNKEGQPLMPTEIQDDLRMLAKLKAARFPKEDIRRCLESNRRLKNHVIDFDWYVEAWRKIKDQKRALLIQDSVLWSFKKFWQMSLAEFAKVTQEANKKVRDVFAANIEWHNVTLGPSFSAKEIKFTQGTSFNGSRFPNLTDFSYTTFSNSTSFARATFGKNVSFARATFGKNVSFARATFGDHASFLETIFGDHDTFSFFSRNHSFFKTTFGKNASFAKAKFGNNTSFVEAKFGDKASFDAATLGDNTRFLRAGFGGDTLFSQAKFGNNTSFVEAKFGGDASFAAAKFDNGASFSEAFFCDKAVFGRAKFGDDASFSAAKFDNNASFSEVTFGEGINLRHTIVEGKLDLIKTNWEGRTDFREARIQDLSWDSTNRPSSVKGVFDAREAKFRKAVFKGIRFFDLVDFSDVEFGSSGKISSYKGKSKMDSCELNPEKSEQKTEEFIFQNLIFEKEVDFLRATFRDDAIFIRNRFRSVWDLTGVKFQSKEGLEDPHLCLSFNSISKLFMERQHLGYESSWTEYFFPDLLPLTALGKSRIRGVKNDSPHSCSDLLDESNRGSKSGQENEQLRDIYKTIESSFRVTNDRLAANEAWYLSMVAYEESQYPKVKEWEFFIALEYWAFLIFGDLPSRYGIDLYRAVLVSAGLMLFFAMIYCCYFLLQIHVYKWKPKVYLKPFPDRKRAFRFRPFERFFQSWEKQERSLHPLKDALFLSGRAFFKLGLGTAYPRTRALVGIASIEWIAGMFMLIHFLLAIKNTLPIAVPFLAVAG